MEDKIKTWHDTHKEASTFGQTLVDRVAGGMGSWRFIIWQTIIVGLWMTINVVALVHHRDPYYKSSSGNLSVLYQPLNAASSIRTG